MMTILTPSSWTTFLGCVGSMKTSWLLPHTPLWVSHSSAHLHKSIVTTMDGKLQAWLLPHTPLWVSHSSSCSTWTCTLQTWWRSWLPQVGPPFLIVLARWRLVDCSPILHYGWATLPHIFTSPLSPQRTASFKHLISSWCFTWTCPLHLNLHTAT